MLYLICRQPGSFSPLWPAVLRNKNRRDTSMKLARPKNQRELSVSNVFFHLLLFCLCYDCLCVTQPEQALPRFSWLVVTSLCLI